jgi:hypothetical protein
MWHSTLLCYRRYKRASQIELIEVCATLATRETAIARCNIAALHGHNPNKLEIESLLWDLDPRG